MTFRQPGPCGVYASTNADVGYRANNALIVPDEPIVIPKDATDQVQYEGSWSR